MSSPGPIQDSAAFCADQVRNHDFANYAATIFAPPDCRRALLALYAFNSEVVRVRDHITQPLPGEIRLQWWTDMLAGAGHGGVEGHPVAAELLLAIRTYELPVEPLMRLIEAHEFDLYNDPMPDKAALEGYLHDTSGALLSLAARITGHSSDEIAHLARHGGFATGLARIVAALPADAARRQLFLPSDVLQRHAVLTEDVFARRATPALRTARSEFIGEARQHLDAAQDLLNHVPPDVRVAFLPLALTGFMLDRLARADADPFVPPEVSRLRTLWTLWRASRSRTFRA